MLPHETEEEAETPPQHQAQEPRTPPKVVQLTRCKPKFQDVPRAIREKGEPAIKATKNVLHTVFKEVIKPLL